VSYWRRSSIPGRTARGIEYLLDPSFAGWDSLTDYQLCYWHCLEVERLGAIARRDIENWVAVEFDDLVGGEGFHTIVDALGLPEPNWTEYYKRRLWHVNRSPDNYYALWPDGNLDEQEAAVREALNVNN
jgi:hypothetical protein